MNIRVGIGVDAHRKEVGIPLYLGGVLIPSTHGLLAHSDGDVLCHSILEAILGASNLGDKGKLFPDTDQQYKGIRSTILLAKATELLFKHKYKIINLDVSVMCEEPKLAPHISEMKNILAESMNIKPSQISIKGTTLERLGFTGRNEGIAAMAVALLECFE